MSKAYLIQMIEMGDDSLNTELENIKVSDFRKVMWLALKEQDRDTRHACAEAASASLGSIAAHSACMKCRGGLDVGLYGNSRDRAINGVSGK